MKKRAKDLLLYDIVNNEERRYSFTRSRGMGNIKTYFKRESELTDQEQELLFANLLNDYNRSSYEAQFKLKNYLK